MKFDNNVEFINKVIDRGMISYPTQPKQSCVGGTFNFLKYTMGYDEDTIDKTKLRELVEIYFTNTQPNKITFSKLIKASIIVNGPLLSSNQHYEYLCKYLDYKRVNYSHGNLLIKTIDVISEV